MTVSNRRRAFSDAPATGVSTYQPGSAAYWIFRKLFNSAHAKCFTLRMQSLFEIYCRYKNERLSFTKLLQQAFLGEREQVGSGREI
jgi:hypothetical protein